MTTVILIGKILLCILCVLVIAVVAAQKPADDNPGAAFGQGVVLCVGFDAKHALIFG